MEASRGFIHQTNCRSACTWNLPGSTLQTQEGALQKNITGINKGMGMGTGTGKMVTLLRSCDSCMRHCSTASLPCTNQHQDIFCWTENTQQSNYGCRTRGNTGAQEARGRPHATWQVTCPRPPHCRSRIDGLHIKLWRTHVPQYNL